jgi:hypothetical protein
MTVRAKSVVVVDDYLVVRLEDQRSILTPLAWFPRLVQATPQDREQYEFLEDGEFIHWPTLDEDIEVGHLLDPVPLWSA